MGIRSSVEQEDDLVDGKERKLKRSETDEMEIAKSVYYFGGMGSRSIKA